MNTQEYFREVQREEQELLEEIESLLEKGVLSSQQVRDFWLEKTPLIIRGELVA